MPENLAIRAFVFGLISAVSLPLGALTAAFWKPRARVLAFLLAFGSGALLAALTIDLVADALEKGRVTALILGCICGGALFVVLNQAINDRGGFLRKAATTMTYLKRRNAQRLKLLLQRMGQVDVFSHLPPEEAQALVPFVTSRSYARGTTIFHQGDAGDSLYIIESGKIDVVDASGGKKVIATLGQSDVLGEMALVTGELRSASAIARTDCRVWVVLKEHFDRVLKVSPRVAEAVRDLVSTRITDLKHKESIDAHRAEDWAAKAAKNIDQRTVLPSETEVKEAASAHGGAPLAIWLGILLDGIPESLVIGASLLHASISFSLIGGLFLSNYPEALSSSVGMRRQGNSFVKVFLMWLSLMIITGIGAFFGNIFFVGAPASLFIFVEGLAAGAMLTMIAETMLPEAYYKGGAITGFSTLLGFLAAIFFKTLE
ncbi:MAG: cyclic nucleotide-binding domain-containing protein [Chitinivibrionales bacterium]|nr:cyclic nucleotide-binding domain-containing protein [Chitinivibrionales bacterium]MBD3396678.1 cyclic nucleotide-binding domain-containing protein [Chitinivibrionales bacterium]